MLENEENIVIRASSGDPGAFGALYDEYHPRIYRFVFLKVSIKEDAEDITHQVFVKAWENVSGYEHKGFPFSSWLYRMARNAVIDHYRTRKETVDVENVDPNIFALSENVQSDISQAMEMERVRDAIAKLSALHQDVIIMRFVEEFSIREVAETLKKTEGAIKLLQHRAMQSLQKIMSDGSKTRTKGSK